MRTLKNLGHGGLHQGDPTGDEVRDFYGNIVEGATEEELNRLRQLQRAYDKAEQGIVDEGLRPFSRTYDRDRDILKYQQYLTEEIDNLRRDLKDRKRAAATMSEARASQEFLKSKGVGPDIDTSEIPVREDRLSTFAQGGKTPMTFMKPKYR